MTKVCPSRRSKSNTPWCAWISMPRTASWSVIVADLTEALRSATPPPGHHLERIDAGPCLVHAHRPDAQKARQRGQRDVGGLAVGDRTRTVLVGEECAQERLAARSQQDRQPQRVERREMLEQLPV